MVHHVRAVPHEVSVVGHRYGDDGSANHDWNHFRTKGMLLRNEKRIFHLETFSIEKKNQMHFIQIHRMFFSRAAKEQRMTPKASQRERSLSQQQRIC